MDGEGLGGQFKQAIRWGHPEIVTGFVRRHPELLQANLADLKGTFADPLYFASLVGRAGNAEALLDAGANVNGFCIDSFMTRTPTILMVTWDLQTRILDNFAFIHRDAFFTNMKHIRQRWLDIVGTDRTLFPYKEFMTHYDAVFHKHLPQRQRHLECAHALAWVTTRGIPGNIWVDMAELVVKRWLAGFKTNWE